VQREIRVGMSGADVVSALGSPNMVTTDDKHRETWVYDKVTTERVSSSSGGGLLLMLFFNRSAGASSTAQRTLTIIIKFDEKGLVRDYSYRQSSF
jgi:outer membrane protein assembly factor BamE (lipoprotein component of BamABCDE complex)